MITVFTPGSQTNDYDHFTYNLVLVYGHQATTSLPPVLPKDGLQLPPPPLLQHAVDAPDHALPDPAHLPPVAVRYPQPEEPGQHDQRPRPALLAEVLEEVRHPDGEGGQAALHGPLGLAGGDGARRPADVAQRALVHGAGDLVGQLGVGRVPGVVEEPEVGGPVGLGEDVVHVEVGRGGEEGLDARLAGGVGGGSGGGVGGVGGREEAAGHGPDLAGAAADAQPLERGLPGAIVVEHGGLHEGVGVMQDDEGGHADAVGGGAGEAGDAGALLAEGHAQVGGLEGAHVGALLRGGGEGREVEGALGEDGVEGGGVLEGDAGDDLEPLEGDGGEGVGLAVGGDRLDVVVQ